MESRWYFDLLFKSLAGNVGDGNNSLAANFGDVNNPFAALANPLAVEDGNNSSAVSNSGDVNKPLDGLANGGGGTNSLAIADTNVGDRKKSLAAMLEAGTF